MYLQLKNDDINENVRFELYRILISCYEMIVYFTFRSTVLIFPYSPTEIWKDMNMSCSTSPSQSRMFFNQTKVETYRAFFKFDWSLEGTCYKKPKKSLVLMGETLQKNSILTSHFKENPFCFISLQWKQRYHNFSLICISFYFILLSRRMCGCQQEV